MKVNKNINSLIYERLNKSLKECRKPLVEESDAEYEEFVRECQANPTYKKAKEICEKYGRNIAPTCYVTVYDNGAKYIDFRLYEDREDYKPRLYLEQGRGQAPHFRIDAPGYGVLTTDEFGQLVKDFTDAYNLALELNELDLYSLYNYKEEE